MEIKLIHKMALANILLVSFMLYGAVFDISFKEGLKFVAGTLGEPCDNDIKAIDCASAPPEDRECCSGIQEYCWGDENDAYCLGGTCTCKNVPAVPVTLTPPVRGVATCRGDSCGSEPTLSCRGYYSSGLCLGLSGHYHINLGAEIPPQKNVFAREGYVWIVTSKGNRFLANITIAVW